MERTIRVTGKGKLSLRPDTIQVFITQERLCPQYEDAVRASTEDKQNLTAKLVELGFLSSDLKTLSYNVNSEFERYQDRNMVWKNRLLGYRYHHQLRLTFPDDKDRLGQLLYMLANCPDKPEFHLEYTLADPEQAKNTLLAKAVEDSRRKAQIMAAAAGVTLGEVCSIDYSWGEIDFISRPMTRTMSCDCAMEASALPAFNVDIQADDINVSDTVTIVWDIK